MQKYRSRFKRLKLDEVGRERDRAIHSTQTSVWS